jgi:hypothetical protein
VTPAESDQLARIETNLQRHTDFMDERYGAFVGAESAQIARIEVPWLP